MSGGISSSNQAAVKSSTSTKKVRIQYQFLWWRRSGPGLCLVRQSFKYIFNQPFNACCHPIIQNNSNKMLHLPCNLFISLRWWTLHSRQIYITGDMFAPDILLLLTSRLAPILQVGCLKLFFCESTFKCTAQYDICASRYNVERWMVRT